MVEEQSGIDALAAIEHLEMEVVTRGVACGACESNHLSGLDMLSYVYEVNGLVTVERLYAIGVLHSDAVAVAGYRARPLHDTVKSSMDAVVWCVRLDVYTRMVIGAGRVRSLTQLVICTGDVAAYERIAPMLWVEKFEIDLCRSCGTKVFGSYRIEGSNKRGEEALARLCEGNALGCRGDQVVAGELAAQHIVEWALSIGVENKIGRDGCAIDQKGNVHTVAILTFVSLRKNLSGLDAVVNMDGDVVDVAVKSLQSIVVRDDNERPRQRAIGSYSHTSGKDRLYLLVFSGYHLQLIFCVDARMRCCQWIGIFARLDAVEMDGQLALVTEFFVASGYYVLITGQRVKPHIRCKGH